MKGRLQTYLSSPEGLPPTGTQASLLELARGPALQLPVISPRGVVTVHALPADRLSHAVKASAGGPFGRSGRVSESAAIADTASVTPTNKVKEQRSMKSFDFLVLIAFVILTALFY